MKNFKKRALSLICVASLLISCSAVAFAVDSDADSGSLTGESNVNNPIYQVTMPASALDFTLDPLELLEGGDTIAPAFAKDGATTGRVATQIASDTYTVTNMGENAVVVGFSLRAVTASGVNLVASTATKPEDTTATTKDISLAIISGLCTDASGLAVPTAVKYDSSASTSIVSFDATTKLASFAFALSKGDGTSTSAGTKGTDATSHAGFRFFGSYNVYSADPFKDNDVKILGAYRLQAIKASAYTAITTTDVATDMAGVATAGQLLTTAGMAKYVNVKHDAPYFSSGYDIVKGTSTTSLGVSTIYLPGLESIATATNRPTITVASVTVSGGALASARTLIATDYTFAAATDKLSATLTLKGGAQATTTLAFNTNAAALAVADDYTITVTLNQAYTAAQASLAGLGTAAVTKQVTVTTDLKVAE